jgi:hypothetical protein
MKSNAVPRGTPEMWNYINRLLARQGYTVSTISANLIVDSVALYKVFKGDSQSRWVKEGIARLLEKNSWTELAKEAIHAVTVNPANGDPFHLSCSAAHKYIPLTKKEKAYIRLKLLMKEESPTSIARRLGVSRQYVHQEIGFHRATRVQKEVIRILGKASWDEVVAEAREATAEEPVMAPSERRVG